MKVALLSSQFFNAINYLLAFSRFNHEFIWVPLVPLKKKAAFEEKIARVPELDEKSIQIHPIFLHAPNNSFKNILNPWILLNDSREIFRALVQLRPDAIVVSYVLDAYPVAMLKPVFDFSLFVVASGGDINLHQSWIHTFIRKIIYRKSDIIFAVSKDLRSKILRESRYETIVVPTGVDPSFFRALKFREALRKKWGFAQGDILLLTVSNLEKHKGVDVAIRAIEILRKYRTKNLRLIIIGEGSQRKLLLKLARNLNLESEVKFLGEKTKHDLLELYNIADFFVLPSHSEGLPFSLLEAMACEAVCISTPVGDIPDVLKDGVNGFIAKSANPSDFAKAIDRALTFNEFDKAKLGANGRATVVQNFDLNIIAEKMIEIISIQISVKRAETNRMLSLI